MRTPIWDFVKGYASSDTLRLHMPGHKGVGDIERFDITEICGADSLYEADGIIAESERYASDIFGAHTFYSAEGSSLAIRAMLFLATARTPDGKRPLVLAGRNAHRAFISAAAMLDLDVEWIDCKGSYMSCPISAELLESRLADMDSTPSALYITSPDYLGNVADINALSGVCKKHGILLLVDNAHGAYLKFLKPSRHPIDLGADMCTDSAHKTLPVLTGGAYLHIRRGLEKSYADDAKRALSLFGSSSPSYLILSSLDKVNAYLNGGFACDLSALVVKIADIKSALASYGYTLVGNEELKLTIDASAWGYRGEELAGLLRGENVEPEMAERNYLVFMLSPADPSAPDKLLQALLGVSRKEAILDSVPAKISAEKALTLREATLAPTETLPLDNCVGRVLASADVSCPPAVPILMPGEVVGSEHLPILSYYGKSSLTVVKV